jgi:hypothetical protein
VGGSSIEITGSRLSRNYITCPPISKKSDTATTTTTTTRPSLGITLPYLYLTVRMPTLQSDFSFEVTILDDKRMIRRFRASTYQSTTVIKPDICAMPLRLERQRRQLARDALLLPAKKQKLDGNHPTYPDRAYAEGSKSYDKCGHYGPGGGATAIMSTIVVQRLSLAGIDCSCPSQSTHGAPTVPITSRPCGYKYTPIVG